MCQRYIYNENLSMKFYPLLIFKKLGRCKKIVVLGSLACPLEFPHLSHTAWLANYPFLLRRLFFFT